MKKKILFLTSRLPYPCTSGGVIKTFHMLKYLSERYDVSLFFLLKDGDKEYLEEFKTKVALKECLSVYCENSRSISNYIKSLFKGKPLSVCRNIDEKYVKKIQEMIKDYDTVFVDHFFMSEYVKTERCIKTIYHAHNAEYILWKRYSENCGFLKKIILKFESKRIKNYEKNICERFDHVVASSNDILELSKLIEGKDKFSETMHLGNESLLKEEDLKYDSANKNLMFLGTLSWKPNFDGIVWFLEKVWPSLKKNIPDITLDIIGKNENPKLDKLVSNCNDVKLLGFVDSLEDCFKNSQLFVSPLLYGSGVKVKNIEAMYRGIPLVTTDIGVEGIDVEDLKEVAIANNEQEFVLKIERVLKDKDLWNKLSVNSRRVAREKYTWNQVLSKLDPLIDD